MPRYTPPQSYEPKRRKQADPDVLRSKLNTGKKIGRFNATHEHGEPIAQRSAALREAANRSRAPHGPAKRVPGSQVTHNERLLQKPGEFGPKLIEAIKAKLGNVPAGVTPTKPTHPIDVDLAPPGIRFGGAGRVGESRPLPLPQRGKPRRKPTQTAFPR